MNLEKIFNFAINTYHDLVNTQRKKITDYAETEIKKQKQLLNQLEINGEYQKAEQLRNKIEHNEDILEEQRSRIY